mgnify:CR=1 FL=1
MKKVLILLVMAIAMNVTAQESVLLRLNYKKGDTYLMTLKQDISSAQMDINMNITASMEVTDVKGTEFSSQMKFTKILMDMSQQGMSVSYDSSVSDDELDGTGKAIKSQMAPMLQSVISKKENKFGKVLEAKAEPTFQGSENVGESSIIFPENAVRVGDTWTMDKTTNGVKMHFIYKVKAISKTTVDIELSGKASGAGEGTIKGTMQIDRETGIVAKSSITTEISSAGQDVKTVATTSTTKK